jgi:hypothetical protein
VKGQWIDGDNPLASHAKSPIFRQIFDTTPFNRKSPQNLLKLLSSVSDKSDATGAFTARRSGERSFKGVGSSAQDESSLWGRSPIMRRILAIATACLLLMSNTGCILNIWSADDNIRMEQMLYVSEDLRQIREEWRRFWFTDMPSHLTPQRVHGGIMP